MATYFKNRTYLGKALKLAAEGKTKPWDLVSFEYGHELYLGSSNVAFRVSPAVADLFDQTPVADHSWRLKGSRLEVVDFFPGPGDHFRKVIEREPLEGLALTSLFVETPDLDGFGSLFKRGDQVYAARFELVKLIQLGGGEAWTEKDGVLYAHTAGVSEAFAGIVKSFPVATRPL